jgi:hypothetical protein
VTLPTALRPAVMFSAPNDPVGNNSATWIYRRAATPPARFWGLRSADEGMYGDVIPLNWQNLEVGDVAPATVERDVGTGKGAASASQRLVPTQASTNSPIEPRAHGAYTARLADFLRLRAHQLSGT